MTIQKIFTPNHSDSCTLYHHTQKGSAGSRLALYPSMHAFQSHTECGTYSLILLTRFVTTQDKFLSRQPFLRLSWLCAAYSFVFFECFCSCNHTIAQEIQFFSFPMHSSFSPSLLVSAKQEEPSPNADDNIDTSDDANRGIEIYVNNEIFEKAPYDGIPEAELVVKYPTVSR